MEPAFLVNVLDGEEPWISLLFLMANCKNNSDYRSECNSDCDDDDDGVEDGL